MVNVVRNSVVSSLASRRPGTAPADFLRRQAARHRHGRLPVAAGHLAGVGAGLHRRARPRRLIGAGRRAPLPARGEQAPLVIVVVPGLRLLRGGNCLGFSEPASLPHPGAYSISQRLDLLDNVGHSPTG